MSKNLKTLICCILALVFVSGTLIAVFADSTGAFTTEPVSEDATAEEPTSEDPTPVYKIGDVNLDGRLTAADARLALRAAAQLEVLSAEQRVNADVIPDGIITAADARLILRVSARLEPASILGSQEALDRYKEEPTTEILPAPEDVSVAA